MRTKLAPILARPGILIVALAGTLAACSDQQPLGGSREALISRAVPTLQAFECTASVDGGMRCQPAMGRTGAASPLIYGGQNVYVKLTSSNASYDSLSEIYQFDVTVKNLLNETIGTPDGVTPDPDGIRVFFSSGPTVTGGTGVASVHNADGYDTFLAPGQPYFAYGEILEKNEVSAAHTWQIELPRTATHFTFVVHIETDVQHLLTINEVVVNPGGVISDASGEWFEIYNAGTFPVNLQGLLIADSSTSGRRPYHVIASSVNVPSGGYVVLGNSVDTIANGGVDVNYAYGSALSLANTTDALKISRVYGSDTLTVDRASYANPAISSKNGISRELINPSLDNANMDGGNWADAATTAVYGAGGRGTPGAQNSVFVP